MSNQITVAQINEYKNNVALLLQQKGSLLRHAVSSDTYNGKGGKVVEQIGAVTARKRTTRHGDTPLIETPHDARWVYPSDYDWADLIDDPDRLRIGIQPDGAYSKNGAFALGRAIDDTIIEAFFGDSATGEDGDVTTVFDTANHQVLQSVGATADLNVTKLLAAKKIMRAGEVDQDEPVFCAITAEQEESLLNLTTVTSADYNESQMGKPILVDGKLNSFLGINFIHIQRVGVTADPYRRVPMWVPSGVHLGMWNDITTRITERDDKNYSTQIYVCGTFGATRVEEGKVIEILCDEA